MTPPPTHPLAWAVQEKISAMRIPGVVAKGLADASWPGRAQTLHDTEVRTASSTPKTEAFVHSRPLALCISRRRYGSRPPPHLFPVPVGVTSGRDAASRGRPHLLPGWCPHEGEHRTVRQVVRKRRVASGGRNYVLGSACGPCSASAAAGRGGREHHAVLYITLTPWRSGTPMASWHLCTRSCSKRCGRVSG